LIAASWKPTDEAPVLVNKTKRQQGEWDSVTTARSVLMQQTDSDKTTEIESELRSPTGGKRQLRRHNLLVHHDRPYLCDVCGRSYRHRASLTEHVMRAHSEGSRPYLCELCGASFAAPQSLHRHRVSAHVELRRYSCAACGKRFSCSYNRREHELSCGQS